MDPLDSVTRKVALLRSSGAVARLAARWYDDDEEAEREDPDGIWDRDHLELDAPAEPVGDWPGGLGDWYRIAGSARFGIVTVDAERAVAPFKAVDALGEPIGGRWLVIGSVGAEDRVLMDADSGEVAVYFSSYFRYGWDSPVMVRSPSVPAFLDAVATGPDYRLVRGPVRRQREPWWEADPWHRYMVESGMIAPLA